ncbi:MAG: isochorismatase family protein [Flavobacterium sp.]|nr:MAG: isochorismatase family protein [Flavobacterium sp.]
MSLLFLTFLCATTTASSQVTPKAGLGALLTPENCVVLLVDHQPFQFATLGSHNVQSVISNVVALAKTAKVFGVPTLLTTVVEDRGGLILQQLQDVFPEQKPLNRTWINAWQDPTVTDWVKKTGRKKIVIAGLWTEVCVALPAIQAAGEGYEVYAVTDASAGVSLEAHQVAVQRMMMAGVMPITTGVFQAELQRDWARSETAQKLIPIILQYQGALGTALAWEFQMANPAKK